MEHVRDGFEAAMRMPRRSFGLSGSIGNRTKVIQHQKPKEEDEEKKWKEEEERGRRRWREKEVEGGGREGERRYGSASSTAILPGKGRSTGNPAPSIVRIAFTTLRMFLIVMLMMCWSSSPCSRSRLGENGEEEKGKEEKEKTKVIKEKEKEKQTTINKAIHIKELLLDEKEGIRGGGAG